MHLDELLEKLNPYGRYQILAWVCLATLNCFPPAWHSFSIAFTGFYPSTYACYNTSQAEVDYGLNSTLMKDLVTESGALLSKQHYCYRPKEEPVKEGENTSRYLMLERKPGIKVIAEECPTNDFEYAVDESVTSSMVTEFNLVCWRDLIFVVVSAMEGVGEIFGCVIFGWLSDLIGRRQTYLAASATLFVGGLSLAASVDPLMAGLSRLATGAGLIGMNNVGFVFASEMFPPKERTIFGTLHEMSWGLAVVSLAGVGYIIRTWRSLCVALTLPIVLVLPLWWFVKESLHWLLCSECDSKHYHGKPGKYTRRTKQARKIVAWISWFNGVKFPSETWAEFIRSRSCSCGDDAEEESVVDQRLPSCFRLVATPRIRYITFSVTLLWFANSLAYYGLQWSAQMLQTEFLMSYFLLAVVELPSTIVVLLIMPRVGRRWTIFGFHLFAAICCFAVPFVPAEYSVVSVIVAISGKFAVCSSFTILYVFAVELFPTEIRGFGFAVCSLLGRIGLVAAPFVNWLGVGGGDMGAFLRMALYGISMLLTAFLNIGLPETNNRPLADTIEQTENYEQYCAEIESRASASLLKRENHETQL